MLYTATRIFPLGLTFLSFVGEYPWYVLSWYSGGCLKPDSRPALRVPFSTFQSKDELQENGPLRFCELRALQKPSKAHVIIDGGSKKNCDTWYCF